MRILHTSDWHLGRYFYEYPLREDQAYFLNELLKTLSKAEQAGKPFSALVIAGDIYDKAVPPEWAVELLSEFLYKLSQGYKTLHTFLIAGNHDSPVRLSFAHQILDEQRIHIFTDTKSFSRPFVLREGGDELCVYALPYLGAGSIPNDGGEVFRRQPELWGRAVAIINSEHKKNYGSAPSLLVAHLYAKSVEPGSSERSCLGGTEQVDTDLFRDFVYCAFGHIHKNYRFGEANNLFYCGSPLAYNFDDSAETYFFDATISEGVLKKVDKVPIKPLHKIATLKGKLSDFYGDTVDKDLIKAHRKNFVRIITSDGSAGQAAVQYLKETFPLLMCIQSQGSAQDAFIQNTDARSLAIKSRDSDKVFEAFYEDTKLQDPQTLVMSDLEKADHEAQKALYKDLWKESEEAEKKELTEVTKF